MAQQVIGNAQVDMLNAMLSVLVKPEIVDNLNTMKRKPKSIGATQAAARPPAAIARGGSARAPNAAHTGRAHAQAAACGL